MHCTSYASAVHALFIPSAVHQQRVDALHCVDASSLGMMHHPMNQCPVEHGVCIHCTPHVLRDIDSLHPPVMPDLYARAHARD